jgi:hypothetical protein
MTFKRGGPGGPGRPRHTATQRIIAFDLKQAAKAFCPDAIERLAQHMWSDDERVSLAACIAMLERGFGKPEQKAEATVTHKFAVVPEVMEKMEWLERRGQPKRTLELVPDKTNGKSH